MIGVIGALKEELKIIKEQMEKIERQNILGSDFYCGMISGKKVVVCESSIGKINAAVTASAMIMEYNPNVIINTGIAGSLKDKVKIMDVVVANRISAHDEGKVFNRYYPFINSVDINEKYVKIAKDAYVNLYENLENLYIGEVITGDEFINSDDQKEKIKKYFKNALVVDMECWAIAKVCYRANKNFIVIKTISDNANDNADDNYNNFINLSANKSAKIVIKIIKDNFNYF